jgi:hypothetical protein
MRYLPCGHPIESLSPRLLPQAGECAPSFHLAHELNRLLEATFPDSKEHRERLSLRRQDNFFSERKSSNIFGRLLEFILTNKLHLAFSSGSVSHYPCESPAGQTCTSRLRMPAQTPY